MEQIKLDRINELSRLAKERELTDNEKSERLSLRAEYVKEWRSSVTQVLEHTVVLDDDGNKRPLRRKSSENGG